MTGKHLTSPRSSETGGYIKFSTLCTFSGERVEMTFSDEVDTEEVLAAFRRFLIAAGFTVDGDLVVQPRQPHTTQRNLRNGE